MTRVSGYQLASKSYGEKLWDHKLKLTLLLQIHSAIEPVSTGRPCSGHSLFSATRAEPRSCHGSCAPQLRILALYRQPARPWSRSEGHQEQSETKIWPRIETLGRNKRKLTTGLKEISVQSYLFLKWSSLPLS